MMDLFDIDEWQMGLWTTESYETKIGGGDIFEMGFSGVQDEFSKERLSTPVALENLLFPDQLDPLPLEDGWMERLDMTSFIDMDNLASHVAQETNDLTVQKANFITQTIETPPKPCRLKLLQELLLQDVPQKAAPTSPEAQVAPDIDVLDSLTETNPLVLRDSDITIEISFDIFGDPLTQLSDQNTDIVDSWSREGTSSTSGSSVDCSYESSSLEAQSSSNICNDHVHGGLGQPLPPDDLESILSGSAPSSPCSDDSDYQPSYTEHSCKQTRKSRHNPYGREKGANFLNRKDKKKLQNKNAAIRYRMKKKAECDSIKIEEDALAKRNDELRDKVEQITREIKYMKDLMAEVCKAKRIKMNNRKSH